MVVTPLEVPDEVELGIEEGINHISMKLRGEPFEVDIPSSLGIPTIDMYADGVISYASENGVSLEKHTSLQYMSLGETVDFIREGLSKDSPIALLNYVNSDLESVDFVSGSGGASKQSVQMHWVTITELYEYPSENRAEVKVSTWGGTVVLDLNDVIKSPHGMVYFEVK